MNVKGILKTKGAETFSLSPDTPVQKVAGELARRKIGAVIILDGDRLAGILSERDIVRVVAERGPSALEEPARNAMTATVEVCHPSDFVDDVMARMTGSRFRHMPVVEEGRIVGLVSIGDVVKWWIHKTLKEQEEIKAYIHSA